MGLAKTFGHLRFVVQDRGVVVDMGVKVGFICFSFFLCFPRCLLFFFCACLVVIIQDKRKLMILFVCSFLWGVDMEGEGSGVVDFWDC